MVVPNLDYGPDLKYSALDRVSCEDAIQPMCDIPTATGTPETGDSDSKPSLFSSNGHGQKNGLRSMFRNKKGKCFQCGICDEEFLEALSLKKHIEKYKKKSKIFVRCGMCLKAFNCISVLTNHMKFHVFQDRTACSENLTDTDQFDACIGTHEKSNKEDPSKVQGKVKIFQCRYCQEVFLRSSDLKQHKQKHKPEKPFLCEWCSKTFKQKGAFDNHKRIHTGEKPYRCNLCPAAFNQSQSLTSHVRIHTGEKPYRCEICSLAFAFGSSLRQHLKSHRGMRNYKCQLCTSTFVLSNGLRTHMRSVHSDARPCVCDTCQAAFKLPAHLKRHKLLHTGERPYKCDQCPATFLQKGNMKIHMKVHNKVHKKGSHKSHPPERSLADNYHTHAKSGQGFNCNSVPAVLNTVVQQHANVHNSHLPPDSGCN